MIRWLVESVAQQGKGGLVGRLVVLKNEGEDVTEYRAPIFESRDGKRRRIGLFERSFLEDGMALQFGDDRVEPGLLIEEEPRLRRAFSAALRAWGRVDWEALEARPAGAEL